MGLKTRADRSTCLACRLGRPVTCPPARNLVRLFSMSADLPPLTDPRDRHIAALQAQITRLEAQVTALQQENATLRAPDRGRTGRQPASHPLCPPRTGHRAQK